MWTTAQRPASVSSLAIPNMIYHKTFHIGFIKVLNDKNGPSSAPFILQQCEYESLKMAVLQWSFSVWAQPMRDDFECTVVPHWLGAYTNWSLVMKPHDTHVASYTRYETYLFISIHLKNTLAVHNSSVHKTGFKKTNECGSKLAGTKTIAQPSDVFITFINPSSEVITVPTDVLVPTDTRTSAGTELTIILVMFIFKVSLAIIVPVYAILVDQMTSLNMVDEISRNLVRFRMLMILQNNRTKTSHIEAMSIGTG